MTIDMMIEQKTINISGIKFFIEVNKKEIARAYLYILFNDLHEKPFGFLEDVFVDKDSRGKGIGKQIIKTAIKEAKKQGCYKLIATSRYSRKKVHEFYKGLRFKKHGVEFRIDF